MPFKDRETEALQTYSKFIRHHRTNRNWNVLVQETMTKGSWDSTMSNAQEQQYSNLRTADLNHQPPERTPHCLHAYSKTSSALPRARPAQLPWLQVCCPWVHSSPSQERRRCARTSPFALDLLHISVVEAPAMKLKPSSVTN